MQFWHYETKKKNKYLKKDLKVTMKVGVKQMLEGV
jgi:hypothetical protein